MLLVGGSSGSLRVWTESRTAKKWLPMLELSGHTRGILAVAWAPAIGRSYHLLAAGSADGTASLWRLQPEATAPAAGSGEGLAAAHAAVAVSAHAQPGGRYAVRRLPGASADARLVAAFEEGGPVWRCEWNVMGTVLATSVGDGRLRLRRADLKGVWATLGELEMDAVLPA